MNCNIHIFQSTGMLFVLWISRAHWINIDMNWVKITSSSTVHKVFEQIHQWFMFKSVFFVSSIRWGFKKVAHNFIYLYMNHLYINWEIKQQKQQKKIYKDSV